MERGELQAGNLGFSPAEAKSLLANGQKTLINAQAAMNAPLMVGIDGGYVRGRAGEGEKTAASR
jgi:hypothetical protein